MRSLKNAPPASGFVRRLRDTAGTSIVEAAIITPLLLLLTFSIVDFGALFYVLSGAGERRQPGDALRA